MRLWKCNLYIVVASVEFSYNSYAQPIAAEGDWFLSFVNGKYTDTCRNCILHIIKSKDGYEISYRERIPKSIKTQPRQRRE